MSFTVCTWPCNHNQEREEPYPSTRAVFTAVSAWTSILFVGDQHYPCFLFICLISLSHIFILNVSLPLFLSVFILNIMNENLIYNKVWQPFNGGIQSTHIYCNEWCIWFIISILLILNFWTLLWTLLLFTFAGMNEWLFIFPLCHLEFILLLIVIIPRPGGSAVKNLPAMQEMWVPSLGGEDPLEKEMATHSSILAWEIPWTEETCGLQSMWTQKCWTQLSN